MSSRRRYAVVALAAAFFASSLAPALAEVTPSPTPTPTLDPYKSAQEQFKKDRESFKLAVRLRDIKLREINMLFKATVDKATLDARQAIAAASTPEQKNLINANRRAAVAAAIVARENSIMALGPAPTPPAEPMKQGKGQSIGASESRGKQKR
jgi:hypothetical protein